MRSVAKKPRPLTMKQTLFIDAYIANGCNATEAASQAGYKGNRHQLQVQGSDNLSNPVIARAISDRFNAMHVSAEEVIARLSEISRGDMTDFIDPVSLTIDLKRARDKGKLGLIKKLKYTTIRSTRPVAVRGQGERAEVADEEIETETVEFELYDAKDALKFLAQYHQLLVQRVHVTGDWRGEVQDVDPELLLDAVSEEFKTIIVKSQKLLGAPKKNGGSEK